MTQSAGPSIEIKGTRRGLAISLGTGDWHELLRELDTRLGQAHAFFQSSRVSFRTGSRDMDKAQMEELIALLGNHSIELVSLQTESQSTAEAAQALEVRLALPEATSTQPGVRTPAEQATSEGLLYRRTLRSGQSLRHPGHVVIIGDVNPSAEVIAGGDVLVWGKLRGMVHAGAMGDNQAIVCALELAPTQLRIGTCIAVSPEDASRPGVKPEVASVIEGKIIAVPWSGK